MVNDVVKFVTHLTWDQVELLGAMLFAAYLLLKAAAWAIQRVHHAIIRYPQTQFGFRGKLIYTDDNPQASVFVSHRYELSAKPDFIFKTGFNEYVIVEYKSRKSTARQSDINQLKATALACRSKYRIVAGYVVTGSETKRVSFGSNRSVYREIRDIHIRVKKIKFCNAFPAKKGIQDRCFNCGFHESCMEDRKFKVESN